MTEKELQKLTRKELVDLAIARGVYTSGASRELLIDDILDSLDPIYGSQQKCPNTHSEK